MAGSHATELAGRSMDKRHTHVAYATVGVALWLWLGHTSADSWGHIKHAEVFSLDREYTVKIEPDENGRPGHCRGTLFELLDGKTQIWSRHLINNVGPVKVFVADSGNYVVTLDEWGKIGTLPVVIYGDRGKLIRVHSIDSLGLRDETTNIDVSISSFWWSSGSVSFFGPDDETFFIRLLWAKWRVLGLRDGELLTREGTTARGGVNREHLDRWDRLCRYRRKTLATRAVAMLSSKNPDDRATGALVCGQEHLTDAIPKLRALLSDQEYSTRSNSPKVWRKVYCVREVAKAALEALGQKVDGVVIEEPCRREQ